MEGGLYVMKSYDLKRKYYVSSDSLADEIYNFLASKGRVVTLATDYNWWAKQLVTPYVGYVANVSVGYKGPFSKKELLVSLENKGLSVTPHTRCDNFFYVRRGEK